MPEDARRDLWELLWMDPEGRNLLWWDSLDLVRQRIGRSHLARPRRAAKVGSEVWSLIVANHDGTRVARAASGLVLITRLLRRAKGSAAEKTPRGEARPS